MFLGIFALFEAQILAVVEVDARIRCADAEDVHDFGVKSDSKVHLCSWNLFSILKRIHRTLGWKREKTILESIIFHSLIFCLRWAHFGKFCRKLFKCWFLPLRWDADAEAMWQQQGPPVLPVLLLHAPIRAVLCRWEILKHPPRTHCAKLRAWRFEWSGDLESSLTELEDWDQLR